MDRFSSVRFFQNFPEPWTEPKQFQSVSIESFHTQRQNSMTISFIFKSDHTIVPSRPLIYPFSLQLQHLRGKFDLVDCRICVEDIALSFIFFGIYIIPVFSWKTVTFGSNLLWNLPWICSDLVRFEPVRTRFRQIAICLNLELDLRFSSGWRPNLELNLGSVHIGSGSNLGSEPNLAITTWKTLLEFGVQFAEWDMKGRVRKKHSKSGIEGGVSGSLNSVSNETLTRQEFTKNGEEQYWTQRYSDAVNRVHVWHVGCSPGFRFFMVDWYNEMWTCSNVQLIQSIKCDGDAAPTARLPSKKMPSLRFCAKNINTCSYLNIIF